MASKLNQSLPDAARKINDLPGSQRLQPGCSASGGAVLGPAPAAQWAIWDTLTILIFLVLLWLPTLDYFFDLDKAHPPMENRMMAKWPAFGGMSRSRDFITSIEDYFNDHFGFRKRLIRWNNHWKEQLFRTAGRRDAIVGRDGWLFYAGDGMLQNCTHEAAWSQQELSDWCRLLEMRRDWLHERGIKYLFAVAPDKDTVYPEYLPAWIEVSKRPTKIQQLVQYLKSNSTVEVVDLSLALIEAKKMNVEFLKTDTHWNRFGGFIGYRALADALGRQMPGVKPLPLEAYTWASAPAQPGDLYRIMGSAGSYSETAFLQETPHPNPTVIYDAARFRPHVGIPETRSCLTLNKDASGKALIFHDSFACSWYAFLDKHFREVVYVWQYDWDRPLIEREKPDVVIDEMLEWYFNAQNPNELASKDQAWEAPSSQASR